MRAATGFLEPQRSAAQASAGFGSTKAGECEAQAILDEPPPESAWAATMVSPRPTVRAAWAAT